MKQSKYVRWAVIFGIVVVLNLFFNYSLKVIYNAPEREDFCEEKQVIEMVESKEECVNRGGQWNEAREAVVSGEDGVEINRCDLEFACRKDYLGAMEKYERKVFVSLIVLGVISIVIGLLLTSYAVVSTALSFGGVLSFVIASMRYWQFASEYLQVVILGLALVALVYIGIKKVK
ncbi:hypothetical protein ACFL2R_02625 [Patescibacteria group bacterium]